MGNTTQKGLILQVIQTEVAKARAKVTDEFSDAVEAAAKGTLGGAKVNKLLDDYADTASAIVGAKKLQAAEESKLGKIKKDLEKLGVSVEPDAVGGYGFARSIDETKPIRPQLKAKSILTDLNATVALEYPPSSTGYYAEKVALAQKLVDPKPYAVGKLKETFAKYPDVEDLLPAMGYGGQQVKDLEATINKTPCDLVVIGTPIDLRRVCKIKHPTVRVEYELQEIGAPDLTEVLTAFVKKTKKR